MKEEVMGKVRKMAKVSRIVTNIVKVLMIIVTVLLILFTIVVAFIPKDVMKVEVSENMKVALQIPETLLESIDQNWEDVKAELENDTASGITIGMTVNGADLEADSIVWTENGMEIQAEPTGFMITLSSLWKIMVMAVVTMIAGIAALWIFSNLLKKLEQCDSPFDEDVIRTMQTFAIALIPCVVLDSVTSAIAQAMFSQKNTVFELNLSTILLIAAILGLVWIFKYGAMLQQESDETL